MGKGIWENPVDSTVGRRFPIGNACSCNRHKRTILICVCGRHLNWQARTENMEPTVEMYWWKTLVWENQPPSSTMYTFGLYSRECDNLWRYCWQNTGTMFRIQDFCRSNWKITKLGKSVYFFVVLWHGRSCQEMRGTILWVGEQNDSTTLQSINSMHWRPSFQRRRIEICRRIVKKYAHKLFWNANTWHVLEDPIFYGQRTNLHVRSQNGPNLVTNDCVVWYLTSITHVITNIIVKWETLHNNADWDCFKTPILQEILRMQNLHQVEHCPVSEVIRLFHSVGCVRNKLQFSHSSTEWEIISLETRLRLDGISAFDLWDLIVAVLHGNTYQSNQERWDPSKSPMRRKIHGKIDDFDNVDLFFQTWIFLVRKLCCIYLKTTKQWSRWS